MEALLRIADLSVGYGRRALLKGIGFELFPGELVAMIGRNGIGKSTLLRTLAGLHDPISGRVEVQGLDVHECSAIERAKRIAVVLTGRPRSGLLDVRTLVSLGRQPWTGHLGRLTGEDIARVDEALHQAGAWELRDRAIHELSDGECQKVMIARALAQRTPVLLLDEPTAFLDLTNRVRTVRLLHGIAHGSQRAVLFSTHDLQAALDLCDRLLLIRRDGGIWIGAPSEAIAQGVLAAEFDDEQVRFDPGAGMFRAV